MTGRVSRSGSSRWSRSVASPTHEGDEPGAERPRPPAARPRTGPAASRSASAPTSAASAVRQSSRPGGAPRRAPASASRSDPTAKPPRPGRPQRRDQRHSSARVRARWTARSGSRGRPARAPWNRPRAQAAGQAARPGPARRAWRARRPSRRAARTASPCGSSPSPAMSRWTHGPVTNSRRKSAALDQRALRRAGVAEVAVPALHLGCVVVDQRELPVPLAGPLAGGGHRRRTTACGVPKAPVTWSPRARPTAPGQRRHVDEVRGAEPLRVGQRVAEDQPALGVGVDDVDGLAVQRLDDVAGPRRVRAGHVLDRRRDGQERRAGRQPRDAWRWPRSRCRHRSCPSSSLPSGRTA